jgi:hypothetical protein
MAKFIKNICYNFIESKNDLKLYKYGLQIIGAIQIVCKIWNTKITISSFSSAKNIFAWIINWQA